MTTNQETKLTSKFSRMGHPGDRMAVYNYFQNNLNQSKHSLEYIWVDPKGDFRSKTMTVDNEVKDITEVRRWNFDGSSTGQAEGNDSEIILNPVYICPDPFRHKGSLVLCECLQWDGVTPAKGNNRSKAKVVFEKSQVVDSQPWYGLEQEYTLFQSNNITPLGWPSKGQPERQGPYYCGVGAEKSFGRDVAESHYLACLHAGLTISGLNGEVMPGQWEFQVGPCEGLDAGDQLMLARYILCRVCEMFGVIVTFHPKPIKGDWNGAGLHTNFSTRYMREDGGYDYILRGIEKLERKHQEHIKVYGLGNEERLTGHHETSSIHNFSYGVADRGASVRIPRQVAIDEKGYFEDRRPASSACPYEVTSIIADTVILG